MQHNKINCQHEFENESLRNETINRKNSNNENKNKNKVWIESFYLKLHANCIVN